MLGMKKKTVIMVALITTVIMLGITGLISLLFDSRDETIDRYKAELSKLYQKAFYHVAYEELLSNVENEWYRNYKDCYFLEKDSLIVYTYEGEVVPENYTLEYNGSTYEITKKEHGIHVYMQTGTVPTKIGYPSIIDPSYYSINDKNVSYVEKDGMYIVTYDNKQRQTPRSTKETAQSKIKSAVSIAYFDKEWNLQRYEVVETWDSLADTGVVYERQQKVIATYYETSKDDIRKAIEAEYEIAKEYLNE